MNPGKPTRSRTVLAVRVLGVFLLAVVALSAGGARWLGEAWAELAPPAGQSAGPVDGTAVAYLGTVKLEWGMPGELGDPLPTPTPGPAVPPPPDLGEIDLGLELIRSGNTITGHVNLDFTLVFTREHQVGQVWYGPSIAGTFDGTDLTLTSERVSSVSAGQRLMRQFRLIGAAVPEQDGVLRGQYRETIWGYGPQALTVIGTFTLRELKEVAPDLGPSANFAAFPITGLVPLEVAFSDLSTGGPTSWHWSFGDGGISTEQHPVHVYNTPGAFTVTLLATNASGSNTLTVPNYITVIEGKEKIYLPLVLRAAP